ncbi:hypothetical protein [Novosphingobium sp. MMS21-SN21R]|uniref:hypothetical protein n=1 Tax=Novosphingobium sp. MMS21-SN21R TaxID=2969298 RepID=UPI0028841E80|nr:hypothetical protein [Novosphingobium sp. MMS21-SN21R]MDT0506885.1 hypothetical protein [Novosphingobium sp. MMS21-SN21R]
MHTVRNRVAAKPRSKGKSQPAVRPCAKAEPAFMLRTGNPPAFPQGLIVPAPRGAVIRAVDMPAATPRVPGKPASRRKTPVRKAAPVAARKARAAKPSAQGQRKTRIPAVPAEAAKAVASAPASQPLAQDTATMMTQDLLERALALKPEPVETTPTRATSPAPATPPLTAGANPLPRSRALVPQRGHALRDAIAHWLKDTGRWLSARFGRKAADRARVAHANARHRALQSQFEALEALREVAK